MLSPEFSLAALVLGFLLFATSLYLKARSNRKSVAEMEEVTISSGGGWNYRVVGECRKDWGGDEVWSFYVCDVFYDDDDEPNGWGEQQAPYGETPDELADDLDRMVGAFSRPVLYVASRRDGTECLEELAS